MLVNELVICFTGPNTGVGKRSINTLKSSVNLGRYQSIFSDQQKASSMLKPANTKRSASQGIVCECCINRCSKSEMLEYCAEPEKRRKRSLLLRASSPVSDQPVIRSQADVDEFYRQLDEEIQESPEDSSASTFDLREFENQPLIQLLEKQKEIMRLPGK